MEHVLTNSAHRPWPLPEAPWQFAQEWNRALFMHWEVPYAVLRAHVPFPLEVDGFAGKYYVSVVAFSMERVRPRYLPAFAPLSDFHEVNLRTYVTMGGKAGVYFFSLEAEKWAATWVARTLSGFPYQKASIRRTGHAYRSVNPALGCRLVAAYQIREKIRTKTALDIWLTERYCAYLVKNGQTFRYHIHHPEWPLHSVVFDRLEVEYRLGNECFNPDTMVCAQYSEGVHVLTWPKEVVVAPI